MPGEIDDLYLILRAQYAPLVQGFTESAAAGEEMAAKVAASVAEVSADVERMAEVVKTSMGVVDESTMAAGIEFNRLQQQTMAAVAKMDAECNKAVASYERLDAAMTASSPRTKASSALFGLTALAVAGVGYESVKAAGNFEELTTRLVSSAGEAQSHIEMVRQGILDMAGQVGTSADDLARALYIIESGGQHGAAGLTVLRAAAEGAKTEGADLAVVADAVTSVLQDYHKRASDAAEVTSELVAGVGAGKTTFQQLAGSLHSVLPLASSLHIPLSDIIGDLASMTVHGMSADQASQNLNHTLLHLASTTGVQQKELAQFGLTVNDVKASLDKQGLAGTLEWLTQVVLQHMGPAGRVLLSAFNQSKDAARDANIMFTHLPKSLQSLAQQFNQSKISTAAWNQALNALPPTQRNLLEQYATLEKRAHGFNDAIKAGGPAAQTYQDAVKKLTGDQTGLNTTLQLTGENYAYTQGAIKAVSGATTEAGNHVAHWSEIQHTFNQKLSEAKATAGELGIRLGNHLLPAVKGVLDVVMSTVGWFEKHRTAANALGVSLGILAGAWTAVKVATAASNVVTTIWSGLTKVAAAAQWLLNIALDANPIGVVVLAIVAIVAGIYLLWTHSAAFRKFFISVWDAIWGFMKAVGHWFATDFAGFFVMLWHWLVDYVHTVAQVWLAVWNAIWGFLKGVGHWFAHDFVDFFKGAWHWIQDHTEEAINFIRTKIDSVINFVTSMPARIHAAATRMWDGIKDAFRGVINWIIDGWNNLHFTIPAVSFLGFHTPSFTLGLPQIPRLADGGFFPATAGGVLGVLGEAGQNEYALPQSRLTDLVSQAVDAGASRYGGYQNQPPVVNVQVYIGDQEIRNTVVRVAQRNKLRNGRTQLA